MNIQGALTITSTVVTNANGLAAPSALTTTVISQTQINLAWVDNATTETGYRVERSPGGTGTWSTLTTLPAGSTSHNDTTVSADTAYDYRVFATSGGGDSPASNTAGTTTGEVVGTAGELTTALAGASGGDYIWLADGSYTTIALSNLTFGSMVTIKAQNTLVPVVAGVSLSNCDFITVDGLTVARSGANIVSVDTGSTFVTIKNCEVYGLNQFNRTTPVWSDVDDISGIAVIDDGDNVVIQDNVIHDVRHGVYGIGGGTNFTVQGNTIDWVREDSIKLSGIIGGLIKNNTGARTYIPQGDVDHPDFIQFQGSSSDVVIEGNLILPQVPSPVQGIFCDNGTFTNFTIRNNIIYCGLIRAISLDNTKATTTINGTTIIEYNTCLTPPGEVWSSKSAAIIVSVESGTLTKEYNVNAHDQFNDGIAGTNHTINWSATAADPLFYDNYYLNATVGAGVTIEDLAPVPGSPAEATVGAFSRINELLA